MAPAVTVGVSSWCWPCGLVGVDRRYRGDGLVGLAQPSTLLALVDTRRVGRLQLAAAAAVRALGSAGLATDLLLVLLAAGGRDSSAGSRPRGRLSRTPQRWQANLISAVPRRRRPRPFGADLATGCGV